MQKRPKYIFFFSLFWLLTALCFAILLSWNPQSPHLRSGLPTSVTSPKFVLPTLSAPPNFFYPAVKPFLLSDELVSLATSAKPSNSNDNPSLAPLNTLVAEMLANARNYTIDDWHRQMDAYVTLVRQEIAHDEKIPTVFDQDQQYTLFYQATLKHERDLENAIGKLKRTDQQPSFVFLRQRFVELQKLFPASVILQPGHFSYYSRDIADQREFGFYDVAVELSTPSATLKDFPTVLFNNTPVSLEKNPSDEMSLLAKNLPISSRNDTIVVILPGADKLQQATSSAEAVIFPPAPLLVATKKSSLPNFVPELTVLKKSRSTVTLSLTYVPQFSEDTIIKNLNFGWKVQRVTNNSDYRETLTLVFWPYQIFVNLTIFFGFVSTVFLIYTLLKWHAHQHKIWVDYLLSLEFWKHWFFQPTSQFINKIVHVFFFFCRKLRLIAMLLLVATISFHVSLLPTNTDVLLLVSLVLWILLVIGYRLQSSVGFRLAFLLLLVTVVLFFTQPEFYVEDTITWIMLLLIAGVAQEVLSHKHEFSHLNTLWQLIKMFVGDIFKTFRQIIFLTKTIALIEKLVAKWLTKRMRIWKVRFIHFLDRRAPFLVPMALIVIQVIETFFAFCLVILRMTFGTIFFLAIFIFKNVLNIIAISLATFEIIATVSQLHFFSLYFVFEPWKAFVLYLFPSLIIVTIVSVYFLFLLSKIFMLKKVLLIIVFLIPLIVAQQVIYRATTKHLLTDPTITSIDPQVAHNVWNEVHIHGHNFGVAQYNDAKVLLNNKPVRVLGWTSDEVVFMAGPPDVKSGQVSLVNVDQKTSNAIGFTYEPQ